MAKMQAGDLKHRITILYDASGGTADADWQPLFSIVRNGETVHDIPAAKLGLRGRLFYAAAAAQSENDLIFTVRYSKDRAEKIRPTMRIISDGDSNFPYEITAYPVDVADGHQWLEIHAKRVSQNGS